MPDIAIFVTTVGFISPTKSKKIKKYFENMLQNRKSESINIEGSHPKI